MKRLSLLLLLGLLLAGMVYAVQTGGAGVDNPEVFVGVAGQSYISTGGTMTVTTAETFEKVQGGSIAFTGVHLEHFTESNGRLTYNGSPTKDMHLTVSGKWESGETAQDVQMVMAHNGTIHPWSTVGQTFTAQNAHAPISLTCIITMETNDYLEIYATSDTNGDEIIFDNMIIVLTSYE